MNKQPIRKAEVIIKLAEQALAHADEVHAALKNFAIRAQSELADIARGIAEVTRRLGDGERKTPVRKTTIVNRDTKTIN